jgi:heptosyltransferase-2
MKAEPTSILAFRNGSIGNTLAAVPALRALRLSFPHARLSVVVDPLGFQLLELCPWIDRLIVYDKRGADRGLLPHVRLIRTLRGLSPSHAVLFKRFFRNGLLAYLSGAPVRAGFRTNGSAPFLNMTIPFDETVHVVDANLELAQQIGAQPCGRHVEIFLSDDDLRRASALVERHLGAPAPYLAAHYGGSSWHPGFFPPRRFAELLDRLAGGLPVFLTGSGAREAAWAEQIAGALPKAVSACDTPVRTLAALLRGARYFIGFNSGPTHLAAATGTPAFMIFKPDPSAALQIRRWMPPGGLAYPLLPPVTGKDEDWETFFKEAVGKASTLARQ